MALDLAAQAEHGPDSARGASISPSADAARCGGARGAAIARRAPRCRTRRSRSCAPDDRGCADRLANEFAPEHLELAWARTPRCWRTRYARAAACSSAAPAARRSATTRRAPTTCCPRAAPRASRGPLGAGDLPAPHGAGIVAGRRGAALAPDVRQLARAEGFPVHAESMERPTAMTTHRAPPRSSAPPARPDIRLSLALDGAGECSALDRGRLLRPHARRCWPATAASTSTCEAQGDLETGTAPHDRGHRASCSGRRSTRRSATARHRALRRTPRADGRGARRVRDRRLRAPVLRVRGGSSAEATIAGFESELAEEFFRAVANNAKLTLHVRVRGRHQRAPHGRGELQVVRPRAARGRGARSDSETGHPVHEGAAVSGVRGSRSSTTGWATCARSRRRFEHVGRAGRTSRTTTTRSAARTGVVLPGVGAFPKAMESIRELGLDELIGERLAARRADARHLPRHAAAVRDAAPRTAGPGARPAGGRGASRSTRPG